MRLVYGDRVRGEGEDLGGGEDNVTRSSGKERVEREGDLFFPSLWTEASAQRREKLEKSSLERLSLVAPPRNSRPQQDLRSRRSDASLARRKRARWLLELQPDPGRSRAR